VVNSDKHSAIVASLTWTMLEAIDQVGDADGFGDDMGDEEAISI